MIQDPAPVGPLNPPKILPSTINQQYTTVHATDRIAALHDPLKQQQQQRQQQHQQHKQHEIVQQPGQQNIQIHYFDRATQNKHQQFFLSKLNVARYTGRPVKLTILIAIETLLFTFCRSDPVHLSPMGVKYISAAQRKSFLE